MSHSWDACPIRLVSVFWPVAARAIFSARVRPLGNLRVWKGFYEYSTRDQTENRISFRAIQKIKYKLIFAIEWFNAWWLLLPDNSLLVYNGKDNHFYQPQEYLDKYAQSVHDSYFKNFTRARQVSCCKWRKYRNKANRHDWNRNAGWYFIMVETIKCTFDLKK